MRLFLGILFLGISAASAQQQATVTIFTPDGAKTRLKETSMLGAGSGRDAFLASIYEGDRKLGFFSGAHFLTFTIAPGKHVFAVSDHQNKNTPKAELELNVEPGRSYFVRALQFHKGAFVVQSYHWELAEMTCEEARREADTLTPLSIKKVGKDQRDDLVGTAYFPSCKAAN